jgi:hypothetical protein
MPRREEQAASSCGFPECHDVSEAWGRRWRCVFYLSCFGQASLAIPYLIETSAYFFCERHQLSGKLWVVTQHRDAAIPLSGGGFILTNLIARMRAL